MTGFRSKVLNIGMGIVVVALQSACNPASGPTSQPLSHQALSSQLKESPSTATPGVVKRYVYTSTGDPTYGIAGLSFDPDARSLTPLSSSAFASTDQTHIHRLATSSDGRFIYGTNLEDGIGLIYAFSVNAHTGALAPLDPPVYTVPLSTRGFFEMSRRFNFNGQDYLYIGDYGGDEIFAYSINAATGALTPVDGSPFLTPSGCTPADMAITPNQRYFYVACQAWGMGPVYPNIYHEKVAGFALDPSTGAIRPLPDSPYPAPEGSAIYGMNVSKDGRHLYGLGLNNNSINAWDIDPSTGDLTAMIGSPFHIGGNFPLVGWIDPTGTFLYMLNIQDTTNALQLFDLDPVNGHPSVITNYALPARPDQVPVHDLAIDPDGLGVFVISHKSLYAYSRDASSGTLTPLSDQPIVINSTDNLSYDPGGLAALKIVDQDSGSSSSPSCQGPFCGGGVLGN